MRTERKILYSLASLLFAGGVVGAIEYGRGTGGDSGRGLEGNKKVLVQNPTSTLTSADYEATIASLRGQKIVATETPLSPEQPSLREEVMGKNEITSWDAEISLIPGMNRDQYNAWIDKMKGLKAKRILGEGDIRTYDKIEELKSFGNSFEFFKADNTFPQAKEVVSEAVNIGGLVLEQLGYQGFSEAQAKVLGLKLIDMTVNRTPDGQNFYTKNSFVSTINGKARSQEAEKQVCSRYSKDIQIGDEVMTNGILQESNEAHWNFVFNISDNGIKSKYPELKTLRLKKAGGGFVTLSFRLFDFGSQPGEKAGMRPVEDKQKHVWGSEVTKPCGPQPIKPKLATTVPPTPQPVFNPPTGGGNPPNPPENTPVVQKGPDPFNNGKNDGSDMQNRDNRGTGGGAANADSPVQATALSQTGTNEH